MFSVVTKDGRPTGPVQQPEELCGHRSGKAVHTQPEVHRPDGLLLAALAAVEEAAQQVAGEARGLGILNQITVENSGGACMQTL